MARPERPRYDTPGEGIVAMTEGGGRTTIYMMRHGEPAAEFRDRLYGQLDVPLSERGREQSRATAHRLSGIAFDAVYSSPLERAGYLADLLAEPLGLPVRRLDVFRERCLGVLQGLTADEMRERHPEAAAGYLADRVNHTAEGGGENYTALRDRVVPGILTLAEAFAGGRVAVAAHAGPIRVALAHFLGMPLDNVYQFQLDYGCINVVELSPGEPVKVRLING